jgi:hypothetical protein
MDVRRSDAGASSPEIQATDMSRVSSQSGWALATFIASVVVVGLGVINAAGTVIAVREDQAVLSLSYGVNKAPLTSDGLNGVVVLGRRDEFDAHGFDVLTIYVEPKGRAVSGADFLIVPIFNKDQERLELRPSAGAGCRLFDFRLIREPGSDAQLITAQRAFGQSPADSAQVTFQYYALKRNADGQPDRPRYYFDATTTIQSRRNYCDVNEAFSGELGLGGYRAESAVPQYVSRRGNVRGLGAP